MRLTYTHLQSHSENNISYSMRNLVPTMGFRVCLLESEIIYFVRKLAPTNIESSCCFGHIVTTQLQHLTDILSLGSTTNISQRFDFITRLPCSTQKKTIRIPDSIVTTVRRQITLPESSIVGK